MNDINVLVIDDDDELRFNLRLFLEDEGCNCVVAQSAEIALNIVESRSFDIAIVDLRLPGINGEEFVIQTHPTKKIKKYIIHTGSLDYVVSESLTEIGMTNENILYKPLDDMRDLIDKINQILSS